MMTRTTKGLRTLFITILMVVVQVLGETMELQVRGMEAVQEVNDQRI